MTDPVLVNLSRDDEGHLMLSIDVAPLFKAWDWSAFLQVIVQLLPLIIKLFQEDDQSPGPVIDK